MPKNTNLKVRAKYLLFFLNNKKEKIVSGGKSYNQSLDAWISHHFVNSPTGRGISNFMKIEDLLQKKDELLKNDTLTVCVDLIIYDEYVTQNNPITNSLEDSDGTLNKDFENLLISKKNCDVVITVGDEKFDAHKVVLITRSNVFEAMFEHDMKESKTNEVDIPDVDPGVFRRVLEFIYTDKVEDLDIFADELLEASDKYQLHGLKKMCETSLSKTLSFKNAVRILILADRHSAERLNEFTMNFVVAHLAELKNTEEFKRLEKSQESLAYAVLKKFIGEI
ncbi:speckle-type POZ protein B-like [Cotesia glomerata]|uniref:speckle-type POZ protein B-like n=1 Tax=Cotesia glomerata TaxID=32391 RepID=UPI001D0170AF|nr:speckle-type POZ protein B-like [Cotesia glomerata]